MTKAQTLEQFHQILASKNAQQAWNFFHLDFSAFTEDERVKLEIQLFDEDWHQVHEELARGFQFKKSKLAVDILYKNAFREELDIFEYKPLARKCTWALADIGTATAKAYLQKMASCGDEIIEGFAQKRLDNWDNEIYRKGH